MADPTKEHVLLLELINTHEEESCGANNVARHLYVNRDVALRESAYCRGSLAITNRK